MPVYAYQCNECGVRFERRQSFNDEPVRVCPECENSTVRRLIQPAGVIFKGSGFYSTDNRKSKSGNGSGSKSNTTKTSEKSTSDTKAKAKTETTKASSE